MHPGIDLRGEIGTPVLASQSGRISGRKHMGDYGNTITIDHGDGWETIYAHFQRFAVELGDCVQVGDVVGFIGMTGLIAEPHVHFEIWRDGYTVDPADFLPGVER
jgi:murein DD-endopeptidase MepM/ murein hydrolase activator NlpD